MREILDYRSDASGYVGGHLVALPGQDFGRVVMAPDFGQGTEPIPEPPPAGATVDELLAEVQSILDDVRYHARTPAGIVSETDWSRLGSAADYVQQARTRLLDRPPPAPQPPPGPQPPPPQTGIPSFGGTYGPEHGLAFDLYPGGDHPGALHHGVPLLCPVPCTVERYVIMVGMAGGVRIEAAVMPNSATLLALAEYYEQRLELLAQSPMVIAVATPHAPAIIDGQRAVRFWFSHVQDGFVVGQRQAKNVIALTGNTGIASLPGEASHVHCAASSDGVLTPNGNLPGLLAAKWLGFAPRVTYVPGPVQYSQGGWYRGKPRGQG